MLVYFPIVRLGTHRSALTHHSANRSNDVDRLGHNYTMIRPSVMCDLERCHPIFDSPAHDKPWLALRLEILSAVRHRYLGQKVHDRIAQGVVVQQHGGGRVSPAIRKHKIHRIPRPRRVVVVNIKLALRGSRETHGRFNGCSRCASA